MNKSRFSAAGRIPGFRYAFNGIKIMFHDEHNAWIHLAAAICVALAGIIFRLTPFEWIAIVFAIGLVFMLEAVNTSIEKLSDFVSPGKQEVIKKVKDLAAAGVLISAITALIIGLIIFLPKIYAIVL